LIKELINFWENRRDVMKKLIFIALFFFSLFYFGCGEKPEPEITDTLKAGLQKDAKDFTESLKSILMKEIQTNGIISAVSVCSDTAQILTNNYGITKGIFIKRVSFKNRNPNNLPDEFEAKALKYFEDLKSNGKLDETTEYIDIVEQEGIKAVRYLKPIIIQAPCLNCHGSGEVIIPEVKSIIEEKYPTDKAINYNVGDLRGAVSIQKNL
jgi:hypothetical protein